MSSCRLAQADGAAYAGGKKRYRTHALTCLVVVRYVMLYLNLRAILEGGGQVRSTEKNDASGCETTATSALSHLGVFLSSPSHIPTPA